jgi:hypothetical protein
MRDKTKSAKVAFYRGGYIWFDNSPTPGASGGCLLNEKEEVVAIVVWRFNRQGNKTGAGSLVTESWQLP